MFARGREEAQLGAKRAEVDGRSASEDHQECVRQSPRFDRTEREPRDFRSAIPPREPRRHENRLNKSRNRQDCPCFEMTLRHTRVSHQRSHQLRDSRQTPQKRRAQQEAETAWFARFSLSVTN